MEGLGFAKRNLVEKIIQDNWNIVPDSKVFTYRELLYVIQEMLDQEGTKYLQDEQSKKRKHLVFKQFVELMLYRNVANYDSMVLITSAKGGGKSSAAIMMAKYHCHLLGIRFDPKIHMAYNNVDVMNKIDMLPKFSPLICLSGTTNINIRKNNKEYLEHINRLVDKNDYEVLTYNKNKDIFEYNKPEKTVHSGKDWVYEIELENGQKIRATKNHLFLTKNNEYKKLKDLTDNDELVINTKKCKICNKEFFTRLNAKQECCSKECSNISYKKYVDNNKEERKKCFHYTNLQPLWGRENSSKGGKYDGI
jgi:hypothetical protein